MDFWTVHGHIGGFFFLLFLFLLPRITIVISLMFSVGAVSWIAGPLGVTGDAAIVIACLGWAAWLFVPRWLIVFLSAVLYWHTNEYLCIFALTVAWSLFEARLRPEKLPEWLYKNRLGILVFFRTFYEVLRHPERFRERDGEPTQTVGQRAQHWSEVLGVSDTASAEMIKTAYRRIAKMTHPDVAPDGKGDAKRFREATEAYQRALKK